jgi:hypothetical protein
MKIAMPKPRNDGNAVRWVARPKMRGSLVRDCADSSGRAFCACSEIGQSSEAFRDSALEPGHAEKPVAAV